MKSDVYAFGVVLFEVLSGRKAVDSTLDEEQWGLAAWAQQQIKEGKLNQIIDQRLIGQISRKCLKEFASVAGHCLHTQPKHRPTMAEVVVKLESILSQERESANSIIEEEGFIYKLRSFFTGKVDSAIENKSDFSSHHKPIVITVDTANEVNTNQSFRTFTYAELVIATNGFKDEDESTALNASMEISTQKTDIKLEDFNHPNLVKLLGYCLNNHQLFFVYEDISAITLDKYLYGESGRTSLSWVARLKIATGAAEGLVYLHKRKQPAYSQFKTDLILVDTDFNARLSDFAFDSHSFQLDAYYYAAPEWFRYQADTFDSLNPLRLPEDGMKVYDKRRPLGKQKLVEWAIPLLEDEVNLSMIMDPRLVHNDSSPKGAFKLAQLVLKCLQLKQDKRPSMEYILQVLHHCYQNEIKTV
ncbi:unnamed protein product [Lactuca virosa]|uniref:Protein kinase domain-containing protein n=1 Tax=Lactuca virosa TaxID=75947 RepID=A0AAU9MK82_9ASTR|nr:unnamed protein product [Lactuca virosa]